MITVITDVARRTMQLQSASNVVYMTCLQQASGTAWPKVLQAMLLVKQQGLIS